MMSLPAWLPGPMFLLVRSLSLVPCSFWGSLSRGVSIQGVSLSSGSLCQRPPPQYGEEWAVRILLEYFPVWQNNRCVPLLTDWRTLGKSRSATELCMLLSSYNRT